MKNAYIVVWFSLAGFYLPAFINENLTMGLDVITFNYKEISW